MKEELPPLTIEDFDKKTADLNERFMNNIMDTKRMFMEKQSELFKRLSEDDKNIVRQRELDKVNKMRQAIMAGSPGLVDPSGNKIGGTA